MLIEYEIEPSGERALLMPHNARRTSTHAKRLMTMMIDDNPTGSKIWCMFTRNTCLSAHFSSKNMVRVDADKAVVDVGATGAASGAAVGFIATVGRAGAAATVVVAVAVVVAVMAATA